MKVGERPGIMQCNLAIHRNCLVLLSYNRLTNYNQQVLVILHFAMFLPFIEPIYGPMEDLERTIQSPQVQIRRTRSYFPC